MIDYIELTCRNGIILNSNKFEFAQEQWCQMTAEISWAFPNPTSLSDVKAWFRLVNQISHDGQLIDLMAPFKPLLSPKTYLYRQKN